MKRGYELFSFSGVPIRAHSSLAILGGLLVLLAIAEGGSGTEILMRLMAPVILFVTVLVHELAHTVAARRLGLAVHDVVLTPFGGAARLNGRIEDGSIEARVAAAGPASNLILAGMAAVGLAVTGGLESISFLEIFLLDAKTTVFYDSNPLVLILAFNLLLGTLNLIPAFPMDGGRILRGVIATQRGQLEATRTATRLSLTCALVFFFAPLFLEGRHWWIMPIIGAALAWSSLKERLVVEATEGMKAAEAGSQSGFNPFGFGRRKVPQSEDHRPDVTSTPPPPDGVIDVSGTSRSLDSGSDSQ